ncbi:hypothetical protein V5O48_012099 [Marasmius crinis-equi]|uniref:Alpha/beta-hydrolase n=1 Tax=Marasmius crinis-equi TaxID=585013 RepID=A0ABR3F3U1_9AGAR
MNRTRCSKNLFFTGACLLSISGWATAACQASNNLFSRDDNSTQAWSETSWGSVQTSKDLNWVECYTGEYQCARLQVPLNYNDPEGETASIALLRLPANVSADSAEYRGPILFNPGGPGDSGVDILLAFGERFRAIIGPQFDLVGFDPRGVDRSTPRIEFYKTRAERRLLQHLPGELNHSVTDNLGSYWAHSQNIGALAAQNGKDVLPYMNTDHSARDMLRITEAHGREKLQYWGFSYGSVLGYTFAAMFPDKVERLIIDGVVDIEDYYRTKWLTIPLQIEETVQWFFRSCKEAGPESCAFYEDSVEAMEDKLNGIYTSLIEKPIPMQTNLSSNIIDYGYLRNTLVVALYDPSKWRLYAAALQQLSQGNATAYYSILDAPDFQCDCESDPSKYEFEHVKDALIGYICNDGDEVPREFEEAQAHYQASTEFSSFGSYFASFRISCSGWSKDIPKAQFRGPIEGNTSFPMLLIGNTADPVTPLEAAKNTSRVFPGSVVLTQDSPGHASLAVQSNCTAKVVREYFVNGTLPEEGTVCPMDGSPFDAPEDAANSSPGKRETAPEDGTHSEALRALARSRAKRSTFISPLGL